jgi:hypothetical protein
MRIALVLVLTVAVAGCVVVLPSPKVTITDREAPVVREREIWR